MELSWPPTDSVPRRFRWGLPKPKGPSTDRRPMAELRAPKTFAFSSSKPNWPKRTRSSRNSWRIMSAKKAKRGARARRSRRLRPPLDGTGGTPGASFARLARTGPEQIPHMEGSLRPRQRAQHQDPPRFLAGRLGEAGDPRFEPTEAWKAGRYVLAVSAQLEDPAGNDLGRPFEVDLKRTPAAPSAPAVVRIEFQVRGPSGERLR